MSSISTPPQRVPLDLPEHLFFGLKPVAHVSVAQAGRAAVTVPACPGRAVETEFSLSRSVFHGLSNARIGMSNGQETDKKRARNIVFYVRRLVLEFEKKKLTLPLTPPARPARPEP